MVEPTKRRVSFEIVASDGRCGECPHAMGTWCNLFHATLTHSFVREIGHDAPERLEDCVEAEEKA